MKRLLQFFTLSEMATSVNLPKSFLPTISFLSKNLLFSPNFPEYSLSSILPNRPESPNP